MSVFDGHQVAGMSGVTEAGAVEKMCCQKKRFIWQDKNYAKAKRSIIFLIMTDRFLYYQQAIGAMVGAYGNV